MSTESGSRVAIVTGGSRGIGRGIVRRLAAQGYSIVVGYASNAGEAAAAVGEALLAGGKAIAFQADVADETAVAAMFAEAESQFGGIDVVVHSAAAAYAAPIADIDLGELDALHRTNIRGPFVVAQQAARRVRRGGAIVLLSSSATVLITPSVGPYAASKAAVETIPLTLARELRGKDVSVNAIAPGLTATDMLYAVQTEESLKEGAALSPYERIGQPDEIAALTAFLASPEGHWINGQTIHANGGIA
ncbi:SDR family oxidoreductase [Glycomyces sp. NPDC021274]|uniref:SDR family oxidoreductase n=1 Tax=Glycomyces sp. NPDC021274 TaxID=3155120 RepID=UPI0033FC530F